MTPTQCPVCGGWANLYEDEEGAMRYQSHLSYLEVLDRPCYMSGLLEVS